MRSRTPPTASRLVAALLAFATLGRAASATQEVPLDRLQHPPGTVTGRAGLSAVERRGTGPIPLVLIAGAPFGARAWEGFMARNAERYTMFAVTPAGYGGTPPPPMPEAAHTDYAERVWTEALMVDLVALIERECTAPGKLGPPVVVGHHLMGDYYALRLAYEHPELVRAVVSLAGQGAAPVPGGNEPEARARYVRESRAPFFRGVSQETWNANTFPASSLSSDPERGARLYAEEIGVPIATQVRYYLEYMSDELETGMGFVQAPVLALQVKSALGFDNLSQAMKDQFVKRFGGLEEARKQVRFGGAWDTLAQKAPSGVVRLQEFESKGVFLMDDQPEAFDRALAEFVAGLSERGGTEKGTEK